MSPRQMIETIERDARVMAAAALHMGWALAERIPPIALTFEHEGSRYALAIRTGEVTCKNVVGVAPLVGIVEREIAIAAQKLDQATRAASFEEMLARCTTRPSCAGNTIPVSDETRALIANAKHREA